jgi:hypothetical protein
MNRQGGPRRKDSRNPRTLKRKRAGLLARTDQLRQEPGRSARELFAALAYLACRVQPLCLLALGRVRALGGTAAAVHWDAGELRRRARVGAAARRDEQGGGSERLPRRAMMSSS